MTIRVVIADDQPVVRTGFHTILDADPDLEVVAEAADGREAIALVDRLGPDVVVMDIRMPNIDGISATREIRTRTDGASRSRVLVLTTFDIDEYVYEALRAGASGYLLKDATRDELVRAVKTVAAGDALLAPTVTRRLIEEFVQRPDPARADARALDALTPREGEVFELIGRGMSNAEIAQHLFVGEATVKTHVAHVFTKLDIRDRVQAVIAAYELGVVHARER
ncbi:MAG TPA: response regulator transcription factor [Acidimicrobiia bacterium]|nr:response regulator transcription factor [Acidimicrobiia bacterium]